MCVNTHIIFSIYLCTTINKSFSLNFPTSLHALTASMGM